MIGLAHEDKKYWVVLDCGVPAALWGLSRCGRGTGDRCERLPAHEWLCRASASLGNANFANHSLRKRRSAGRAMQGYSWIDKNRGQRTAAFVAGAGSV